MNQLPFYHYSNDLNKWIQSIPNGNENKIKLGEKLVIVQYNIWFSNLHMKERMKGIIMEIKRVNADIICFQEVTSPILKELLKYKYLADNYYISDCTGKTLGSYGVMILSRYMISSLTKYSLPTRLGRYGLLVTLSIQDSNEKLAIITSHLESYPQDIEFRKQQMHNIFSILKEYNHAIFTADFNFANINEDCVIPSHFIDIWKNVNPNDPGYTFDVSNPVRTDHNIQNRIDRILLKSNIWKGKSSNLLGTQEFISNLPNLRPSDHYGVSAIIEQ